MIGSIAAAATLTLTAGLIVFSSYVTHYRTPTVDERIAADADGIVVLTGGERRVTEALHVFAEGRARRLLISGVNTVASKEDFKRRVPLAPTLFECCIDIGYDALDTIGNAEETRAWRSAWGFRRLLVVTSNYHMPRSLLELARAMPDVELVPHPVIPRQFRSDSWWLDAATARAYATEYLKFLTSLVRFASARAAQAITEPARPELEAPAAPRIGAALAAPPVSAINRH